MRVGIIVDDSIDSPNGVQQIVHTTGTWLASNGAEVHLITSESSSRPAYAASVTCLGSARTVRFNGNVTGVPIRVDRKRARAIATTLDLDVLHVHAPYSPLLAHEVIMGASRNCGIISSFHMAPRGWLQKAGTRALGEIVKASVCRISHFVSDSPTSAELLRSAWKRDSIMIPNPIQLTSAEGAVEENAKDGRRLKLVFLGRLVPRKGCREFIRALSLLSQRARDQIQVAIAGSGPEGECLRRMVKDEGLDKIIEFCGQVSELEKRDLLALADIAVFPSMYAESFGMVLVEAMAWGRASILAGDNPGYRYLLSAAPDALVDVRDHHGFSIALARLVEDAKWRQDLVVRQRSVLPSCDIESIGPQLVSIYEDALASCASS